jgi:ectoine hydroxylase-related dioxygenase (phytanoyl-CoA dioxygenase family)
MTPHPLNKHFTWRCGPKTPSFLTPEQVAHFDRDGYCLVPDVFSAETIAGVTTAIDPWEQRATEFLRTQPNGEMFIAQADAITFTVHLVARSDECRQFSMHPSLLGIARDLIGGSVRMYWDQAVYKKPEPIREFPWHQDNGYAFVEPQQYLTCWIPLTDATLANGCPWIAPGLHRRGTLAHTMGPFGLTCLESVDDAVPVDAPAGSAVVFSSLTPHRTGPNRSETVRKAYIVQYAPTGAVIHRGVERITADAADRQYEVLRDGVPVQVGPVPLN